MDRAVTLDVLSALGMEHILTLRMVTICRGVTGILHQMDKELDCSCS